MKTYEVSMIYEEYFHVTVEVEEGACPEEVAVNQARDEHPDRASSGEFNVYRIRKDGETVWEGI